MSTEITVIQQELNELKQLVNMDKTNRLNDSLFSKELAPHYMQLAAKLSNSSMVPKAYQGKPQDLFIAMAMGYQIGLSVEQAIQAIAVINGKPCLWGDDMLALCMAHPEFDDLIEEPIGENPITGYRCTVKRKGKSDHFKEFTLDMAKRAGLLSKPGPWTQYPERMLQMRARSLALRDRFPDALKGIKSREEVMDYIEAEYKVAETKPSRADAIKQDFLAKIENYEEKINDEKFEGVILVDDPGLKSPFVTIAELLEEKAFSPERLTDALHYYEVDCIESLTLEKAKHFIATLNKL